VRLAAPADVPLLATVVLGSIEPGSEVYGRAEGAVVIEVAPDSPAGQAGLITGDVIVGVNQQPVDSPQEAIDAARQNSEQVLLQVMRNGGMRFVVIS
jgi:S1-C subfamily serine protease